MHTSFEDRDKILRRRGHYNVLSLNKKFHCTLAPEGAFDHSIWRCCDLCNETTQLRPMHWVGRVKAEISRMLANFAAQLSLRSLYLLPTLAMYHARWPTTTSVSLLLGYLPLG